MSILLLINSFCSCHIRWFQNQLLRICFCGIEIISCNASGQCLFICHGRPYFADRQNYPLKNLSFKDRKRIRKASSMFFAILLLSPPFEIPSRLSALVSVEIEANNMPRQRKDKKESVLLADTVGL